MEATSARMARDRYGGFAEPATTPLQRYIQNACDPQNFQPNIALNMEIVDLINAKKGAAPREAAIAIVTHANHRNPNISFLALTLLDNCVKNCGYPFHLQISTKEFLNELVRRFPERPPLRYSRVQGKILELIEEWRQTICQTSKYKDDLGFIRDMHRLLAYKGYVFPEVKSEDAAVLNQSDALQSAEEMEEEERAAQSAKLQELIRRGTPHDLQEANRLMKVMAGYDTRHKTDYRAKAAEEVAKVQQKAKILEEMLQNHKPGDDMTSDTWEELGNALASAQPRIQKMCEEDSDDTEAVAKLLSINDSIHRTLERYRLTRKGDIEGASRIARGTLGVSGAGVRRGGAGNELSLIDFGGPEDLMSSSSSSAAAAPAVASNGGAGAGLENDLLGLSLQGSGPSISLGGPSLFATVSPAQQQQQPKRSNADILSAFASNGPSSGGAAPTTVPPPVLPMSSASLLSNVAAAVPSAPVTTTATTKTADPFAALTSAGGGPPRQGSPLPPFQQSLKPVGGAGGAATGGAAAAASGAEDDWTFASALPADAAELVLLNSSVQIVLRVERAPQPGDGALLVRSSVSNNTAHQIADLTFQVAVMRGYALALEPQSGRALAPRQRAGITQTIRVLGHRPSATPGVPAPPIKVRWRVSYTVQGGPASGGAAAERREEQGEVASLLG